MKLARTIALGVALTAGGCSTVEGTSSRSATVPEQMPNNGTPLPPPVERFAAGDLPFVIIDRLVANWHVEHMRLGDIRFRIALRKNRFAAGGDGEAMPVFYRRAEQIARELGSGRYRVIEFSEGLDSAVPIAQRVAQGVIEIIR